MFTEKALAHFRNPTNAGDLKKANACGKAGDPGCSDVVELKLLIQADTIVDARFKVFGCPGAIATTDCFIDMIKGKKIDDALKISDEDIADELGGLPITHLHCSNLSIEAFKRAVNSYK